MFWDIDYDVLVGKLVVIVGFNGLGKMIMIKVVLGFVFVVLGYICFFGKCYCD